MTNQPHIGIDFGTTTSAVSWWNPKTNAPEIIRNEHGDEKTPSVVYRGEDEMLIGKPAWEQLHDVGQMDIEAQAAVLGRTFLSVKRLLKDNLPLALPDGDMVTPVELAADILAHLKSTAERGCFGGKKVERVSLSYPVIFNKTEKERLKEAASLAGFKECRLVEEPLAAIHGYLTSGARAGNNILVFDMGGGTLDLAFLCKDGDDYHMPIPPMGEETGGDEFDRVLYDHFERKLEQEHGIRFGANGTCNLAALAQCRKLKEKLTSAKSARFSHFDSATNIHAAIDMVREELESLFRDQIDRAIKMAATMLEKIEAGRFNLDTVLLVGGSTRIPMVRKRLAEILPVEPLETMHADVAVAMGASDGRVGDSTQHRQKKVKGKSKPRAISPRPLSAKELAQYRQMLMNLRDQVVDGISFLAGGKLKCLQRDASGDLSDYSLRMTDQGPDNYDREFALNLVNSEQDLLYEIDEALCRIEDGRYGICEETGKPIGRARLNVIPYTRYSEAAQSRKEAERMRRGKSQEYADIKNKRTKASDSIISDTEHYRKVEQRAYYIAEQWGFNGDPAAAWVQAQKEVDEEIQGSGSKAKIPQYSHASQKPSLPRTAKPKIGTTGAKHSPAAIKDVGLLSGLVGEYLISLILVVLLLAGLIGRCGG